MRQPRDRKGQTLKPPRTRKRAPRLAEAKKVAADRVRDLKELEVAAEAVSLRARFQLAEARGDPHFGRAAEPGKAWALSKHHELGLTHRRRRAAFLQNLRLPAIRLA